MIQKLFLALLGLAFVLNSFYALGEIRYPYQLDGGEGYLLHNVYRQSQGESVYYKNLSPPYNFVPYPPVFNLVNLFLGNIVGFSLITGRVVSFLSSLFIGFIVYKIACGLSRNQGAALFSSLIFLTSDIVFSWSYLYRVDMLGLLFTALGLYFIWNFQKGGAFWLVASLFFWLAFFTKFSFFVAPFIAVLYHWRQRKRQAFFLVVSFISLSALSTLFLQNYTEGAFLKQTFFYHLKSSAQLPRLLSNLATLYVSSFGLIIFTFLFALKNFKKAKFFPLTLYLLILGLLVLSSAKLGANTNYYLELIFAMSLFSGVAIGQINKRYIGVTLLLLSISGILIRSYSHPFFKFFLLNLAATFFLALFIFGIYCLLSTQRTHLVLINKYVPPLLGLSLMATPNFLPSLVSPVEGSSFERCFRGDTLVKEIIAGFLPPVLSENSSLVSLDISKPPPLDLCLYKTTAESGLIDDKFLREELRSKKFSLLVFDSPLEMPAYWCRLTGGTSREINENYELKETVDRCHKSGVNWKYQLFVPRGTTF